jgi:Flp pilus assembly protein TadB
MADNALSDITHTIQLAVAPVFLLSALGTTLSVLTTRLGRIIDRARLLESRFKGLGEEEQRHARTELDGLSRRARLIHGGLTSAVGAALCVCVLITLAFVGYLVDTNLGVMVAVLFIVAMGLFVFSLVSFMREALLSLHSLRFGQHAIVEPRPTVEVPAVEKPAT